MAIAGNDTPNDSQSTSHRVGLGTLDGAINQHSKQRNSQRIATMIKEKRGFMVKVITQQSSQAS